MDEKTKKRKSYYKPVPKKNTEKMISKCVCFRESLYKEIAAVSENKSFSETVSILVKESLERRKMGL